MRVFLAAIAAVVLLLGARSHSLAQADPVAVQSGDLLVQFGALAHNNSCSLRAGGTVEFQTSLSLCGYAGAF